MLGRSAKFIARGLINTNYVDKDVHVNMIYVVKFAKVGKCRDQWAND